MGPDDIRIERLAGLARLWGAVTYFHPGFPFPGVDWDLATVEAIDATRAATGKDDYATALERLLAAAGDPATHLLDEREDDAGPAAPAGRPSSQVRIEWHDGIALLDFRDLRDVTVASDQEVLALVDELADATAIVLDVRESTWIAAMAFVPMVTALITDDVALATTRTRRHAGFVTESNRTSGGYESLIAVAQPTVLRPRPSRAAGKPLAIVTDGSAWVTTTVSALQLADKATVVHHSAHPEDSPFADVGGVAHIDLADGLAAVVRTADLVNPDGTMGFSPDAVVAGDDGGRGLESRAVQVALELLAGKRPSERRPGRPIPSVLPQPTPRYPAGPDCPSVGWRLLGLFKQWTVIRWFFPYLELCDPPWDTVLEEFIPRFEEAGTDLDYALAVAQAHTRIQDTHGVVSSAALRRHLGTHCPAVSLSSVEGETVVTGVEGTEAVAVGDVIVAIDGEPVKERIEHLSAIFPASTSQALTWRVHTQLLHGEDGSEVKLDLRHWDGTSETTRTVTVPRDRQFFQQPPPATPVFGVLPGGVGYIDLSRLLLSQVDEALTVVADTPALLFDIRGYPNGTAWDIAPRLAEQAVPVARFVRRDPSTPMRDHETRTEFVQWCAPPPPGAERYCGRVVVLIDERAISQAEHTCLFIESAAPTTTFVGSATNGANGDVTTMVLPGGVACMFSGQGVRHADGRQLQRLGVQPHIEARPTIAGLRAGRDEVLEAGIAAALA